METCWFFLECRFPSFFFGFAFRTMFSPSSKFITWVFGLQIFTLRTLLTKVHTIIDNTFSNSLYSTISRFDLHSNEAPGVNISKILYGPSQLRSRVPLLCKILLMTRSPTWNLLVSIFELKYQAVRRWYTVTQSYESCHFSSRKSSSRRCKIIFCSGSKLSLLKDPASSSIGTMALYL